MRCQYLTSLLPDNTFKPIGSTRGRLNMYDKVISLVFSKLIFLALDSLASIILWSATEPCVGIICACLPTLGPIFHRRALQAIIKSVGSFFAIQSKRSSDSQFSLPITKQPVGRRPPNDTKARPFYPMDDEHSLVTTVQPSSENERGPEEFPL